MSAAVLVSHEGVYGIEVTVARLLAGDPAIDAMEQGICRVEDDHRARTVGYGGAPNLVGAMDLDASIMDGETLAVGAVGAIEGCKHPIVAARRVMEVLPHVLLVGEGASRFAREVGLDQANMLSEDARKAYVAWLSQNLTTAQSQSLDTIPLAPFVSFDTRPDLSKGTVTFLVRDDQGRIFGGVSTSGWAYRYPGRLGDSPIIGAGMYVDSRYGGASCTHTGEMTIRACTARSVVLYMKKGARVAEAVHEAIADLRDLKGGYQGPVIIHAMDRNGEVFVATTGGDDGDKYYFWRNGMTGVEEGTPVVVRDRRS